MRRGPKLTFAASVALVPALVVVAIAVGGEPKHKPTSVAVDSASASPEGVVDVTGSISSPAAVCRHFRTVALIVRRPNGNVRSLDEGFASFQSQVWRLRSRQGAADDGDFFVKVRKQRVQIVTVGADGQRRRTVVCDPARAPVPLF